jgi:hypothetical protein
MVGLENDLCAYADFPGFIHDASVKQMYIALREIGITFVVRDHANGRPIAM